MGCGRVRDAVLEEVSTCSSRSSSERKAWTEYPDRRQGRIDGRRRLVLDYDRLAELDESALTMREIASEMGVSAAFVCKALKARQRLPAPAFGD